MNSLLNILISIVALLIGVKILTYAEWRVDSILNTVLGIALVFLGAEVLLTWLRKRREKKGKRDDQLPRG